jgi:hypothetical protein
MPYNLPLWMCMKQPYFILSLLIPGLTASGNHPFFNRASRNEKDEANPRGGVDVFVMLGHSLGEGTPTKFDRDFLNQAHQYVLFNCDVVKPYIE